MPQKKPAATPNIFPVVRYHKAPQALAWLAQAFGFRRRMAMPNPDGTIAHAEMSLGPGVIMLGSIRKEGENPWDVVTHGLYIHVEDVDTHYRRAKAAGAEIVRELRDTDYGSREYSCRDPEGNLWSFGSYLPGEYWEKEGTTP